MPRHSTREAPLRPGAARTRPVCRPLPAQQEGRHAPRTAAACGRAKDVGMLVGAGTGALAHPYRCGPGSNWLSMPGCSHGDCSSPSHGGDRTCWRCANCRRRARIRSEKGARRADAHSWSEQPRSMRPVDCIAAAQSPDLLHSVHLLRLRQPPRPARRPRRPVLGLARRPAVRRRQPRASWSGHQGDPSTGAVRFDAFLVRIQRAGLFPAAPDGSCGPDGRSCFAAAVPAPRVGARDPECRGAVAGSSRPHHEPRCAIGPAHDTGRLARVLAEGPRCGCRQGQHGDADRTCGCSSHRRLHLLVSLHVMEAGPVPWPGECGGAGRRACAPGAGKRVTRPIGRILRNPRRSRSRSPRPEGFGRTARDGTTRSDGWGCVLAPPPSPKGTLAAIQTVRQRLLVLRCRGVSCCGTEELVGRRQRHRQAVDPATPVATTPQPPRDHLTPPRAGEACVLARIMRR